MKPVKVTMEGARKTIVRGALEDQEFEQIPVELVNKIDEYVDKEFGEYLTAKAVYETGRKKTGKLL